MKSIHWRIIATSVAAISLASAYYRVESIPLMSESANAFLASLTPEQKSQATFSMENADEREFWHFIPTPDIPKRYNRPRRGVTLRDMTPEQRHMAGALLSAGLSREGYLKANTVMSLEEVLRVIEGDSGERRDTLRYHFSVFGTPSEKGVWGYRIEGHHLSLHYTVVNGKLAAAPTFFGANPAKVPDGPRKGHRALAAEEDLARDLLSSLTAEQKSAAIVAPKAYRDILTSADRKAALEGQPSGLGASSMKPSQRKLLEKLVAEYAYNMPAEIASHRVDQFKAAGDNIQFAWAGSTTRGEAHYYRVQAPTFLIEYDNIQNNANHIHSVWRDFSGDFGLDLLAAHYRSSSH